MSSTSITASGTSIVPSAVPTACGATTYDIPTQDAACAILGTEQKDSMEECCNSPVVTYHGGCGMYCLASGQSVGDLVDCLIGDGVKDGQVFCNKPLNATATATPSSTSRRGGDDDDDGDDDDEDGDRSPTSTETSAAATSSGAAFASVQHQPISKPVIGVIFTLLFSTFAGAILL